MNDIELPLLPEPTLEGRVGKAPYQRFYDRVAMWDYARAAVRLDREQHKQIEQLTDMGAEYGAEQGS